MNSGVGDRDSLHKLGIQSVLDLPSVGKNLSDQPIVLVSYSVNSSDPLLKYVFRMGVLLWAVVVLIVLFSSLNTNATLQALTLAQWEFNRTGPLVNPASNFIAWSRLPDNSPIIRQYGDPSAGTNTPHLELVPFVSSCPECNRAAL